MGKNREMPKGVLAKLLPEIFDCLHYFSLRQSRLPIRLHDSTYKVREWMFLNDPQAKGVLHGLLHLSLACVLPSLEGQSDLSHELEDITLPEDSEMMEDLRSMVSDAQPSSD